MRKPLRTIPVVDKELVEVLNEIEKHEGSGEPPNLKRSVSDRDLISSLAKFRLLKTRHEKLNFLRKHCKEILRITKASEDFGINKVCRQRYQDKYSCNLVFKTNKIFLFLLFCLKIFPFYDEKIVKKLCVRACGRSSVAYHVFSKVERLYYFYSQN